VRYGPYLASEGAAIFEITVLGSDFDVFPDNVFERDKIECWWRHNHLYNKSIHFNNRKNVIKYNVNSMLTCVRIR
jgi:hypothetical protein